MDKNPYLPGTPDEFITQNLGLAHSVSWGFVEMARKNDSIKFDEDDFVSIAYLGLIRAYQGFNPTGFKGTGGAPVKFSTYAVPMIKGTLMRHIRDLGHVIRNRGQSVAVDSLDRPLPDDDNGKTLGDLALAGSYSIGDHVFVRDFLSTVGPRLQKVYRLWSRGLSQPEIGRILGISQVTVSKMELYLIESARRYGLGMDIGDRTRFRRTRAG